MNNLDNTALKTISSIAVTAGAVLFCYHLYKKQTRRELIIDLGEHNVNLLNLNTPRNNINCR